jgi:mannose-6-phosphate isomerase-like protein (cupin superfamily)
MGVVLRCWSHLLCYKLLGFSASHTWILNMTTTSINLKEKLELISEHWSPKVIAEMNDYQLKLVKLKGEFVWHQHDETDELFFCVKGDMKIELRDGSVSLTEGELYIVPRGVEHRPVAAKECQVLLIEPQGVVNTGGVESELTAPNDQWI